MCGSCFISLSPTTPQCGSFPFYQGTQNYSKYTTLSSFCPVRLHGCASFSLLASFQAAAGGKNILLLHFASGPITGARICTTIYICASLLCVTFSCASYWLQTTGCLAARPLSICLEGTYIGPFFFLDCLLPRFLDSYLHLKKSVIRVICLFLFISSSFISYLPAWIG